MFKKIACIFLFMSIFLCGCGQNDKTPGTLGAVLKRKKLIVGVRTDAKPFGFIGQDGYNYGFDVDLGSELALYLVNRYANAVEYVPVTAQNRIAYLNSGKVDCLIATMSITENRSKLMDFSIPYYESGQAIMVPHWSKITTLKELNGKRVIIVYGSTSELNVRNELPDSTIMGYRNYDDAVKALKDGLAVAIIADDSILLDYVYNDKYFKILPGRYSVEPYAIEFRKGKDTESLREYTNFFLKEYARTGKLSRLQHKWGLN